MKNWRMSIFSLMFSVTSDVCVRKVNWRSAIWTDAQIIQWSRQSTSAIQECCLLCCCELGAYKKPSVRTCNQWGRSRLTFPYGLSQSYLVNFTINTRYRLTLACQVGQDTSHFSSRILASCWHRYDWMCRDMVTTIHAFSETIENEDMGKVWRYSILYDCLKQIHKCLYAVASFLFYTGWAKL